MALLEGDKYVLISQDLMRHLAVYVEPPAQLCLIRVLGSDHEYVFRVRYGDAHLDYPVRVPLLNRADAASEFINTDEVRKFLIVASAMVVPPGTKPELPFGGNYRRAPQILAPMSSDMFHYWQ